jgi:hypothetical protein
MWGKGVGCILSVLIAVRLKETNAALVLSQSASKQQTAKKPRIEATFIYKAVTSVPSLVLGKCPPGPSTWHVKWPEIQSSGFGRNRNLNTKQIYSFTGR